MDHNCSSTRTNSGVPPFNENSCEDSFVGVALRGIVPDDVLEMLLLINCPILISLAILGMINNSIIIVVFRKIGFRKTINISLLSLAIDDFMIMLTMSVLIFLLHPTTQSLGVPKAFLDASFEVHVGISGCFKRTSNFITTYVAFERCLCIAMPLRVKTMITRNRTVLIMATIYVVTISFMMPTLFTFYVEPVYYPSFNMSIWECLWYDDWYVAYNTNYIIRYITSTGSYVLIIFSTAVMIRTMRRKQDWRKSAVHQPSDQVKPTNSENKDRNVIAMVTFISGFSIVTSTPQWLIPIVTMFYEQCDAFNQYHNMYLTIGLFKTYLECLNASLNFLIYYRMSSKFRNTLKSMMYI